MVNLIVVEIEVVGAIRSVEDSAEFHCGYFFEVFNLDAPNAEFFTIRKKFFKEPGQFCDSQFLETVNGDQHLKHVLPCAVNQNSDFIAVNAFAECRTQIAQVKFKGAFHFD